MPLVHQLGLKGQIWTLDGLIRPLICVFLYMKKDTSPDKVRAGTLNQPRLSLSEKLSYIERSNLPDTYAVCLFYAQSAEPTKYTDCIDAKE